MNYEQATCEEIAQHCIQRWGVVLSMGMVTSDYVRESCDLIREAGRMKWRQTLLDQAQEINQWIQHYDNLVGALTTATNRVKFDRVRKVMEALDWKWGTARSGQIPTIPEMKSMVDDLGRSVVNRLASGETYVSSSSGGFCVSGWHRIDQQLVEISVAFVAEEGEAATTSWPVPIEQPST